MCLHEYWRTAPRPAHHDDRVVINERRPLQAKSIEEARELVAAMPAVVVAGVAHQPTLIENFMPTVAY